MAVSSPVSHPSSHINSTFIPLQYRTFDRIYLLKVKKDGSTVLKILDISQKCLYKKPLLQKELTILHSISIKNSLRPFVETLVQKQLLTSQYCPASNKPITLEDCKQAAAQAIQQYKPKVIAERKEIEGFSCPLTLEVFQDPVMDEHGHTFEKSAIEEHLKNNSRCPISREPICSLTPNRLVKQTIEEYQRKEPIPSFSLFKKENPKLASNNLQLAQNYLQEGEYDEALESYTKAFQYTQDWRHYVELPLLFKKMGQSEKAILAYLYLAHYQLQDGKIQDAIQTLEICRKEKNAPRQIDLLLIQLYELSGESKKALQLAQSTAEALAADHPQQALALYRQILDQNPQQLKLYEPLSQLLPSPQEKAHLLLTGACHALEVADYQIAQKLCQQAKSYSGNSFIDDLLSLELLEQPALKSQLALLAEAYEQKKLPHQALRVYKMLFQLEEKAEYCEKIIATYEALQKRDRQPSWYVRWLSLLMEKKDWPTAERVAQAALEKTSEKISLYQTLETVYTHWQGHQIEDLWTKLGQAYHQKGQLEEAEKTYRKAYQRFHRFELAMALAETLTQQGKAQQSVQMYYEASSLALLNGQLEKLERCVRQIKEIDPSMQYLKTSQRMQLLTQKTLLDLSQKLQGTQEEVRLLKEKVTLREKAEPSTVSNDNSVGSHPKSSSTSSQPIQPPVQLAPSLPSMAFGAAKWEEYFGDVGVEPPLPSNIQQILQSPCPFWPGKRVEETHLLVLVPTAVNGKPLTLGSLGELVKSPRQGNATQYRYFDIGDYTDAPASKSHWVLMTRDVLPGSRSKSYTDQQALVTSYAQQAKVPYEMPHILDATVAIWMHYVTTGNRLYSDNPYTYTRCQEKYNAKWQLGVGGFSPAGLHVSYYYVHDGSGVGGSRKF